MSLPCNPIAKEHIVTDSRIPYQDDPEQHRLTHRLKQIDTLRRSMLPRYNSYMTIQPYVFEVRWDNEVPRRAVPPDPTDPDCPKCWKCKHPLEVNSEFVQDRRSKRGWARPAHMNQINRAQRLWWQWLCPMCHEEYISQSGRTPYGAICPTYDNVEVLGELEPITNADPQGHLDVKLSDLL